LPFRVNFYIPVVKVTCGDSFSGLLTAEGQVHTWGSNESGALGIDQELAIVQLRPDPETPLKFKDEKNNAKLL
jgi:alpha-tubulin suppressor-like RCC1 family protein